MPIRVVIVGAGYAGIEAALTLNRRARKSGIDITIIDKNEYHTYLTELHEVACGRVDPESCMAGLCRIFRGTSVRAVRDRITDFDFEGKVIRSDTAEYPYDRLILAMGAQPNFFGNEGLERCAFTLWSMEDAVRLRGHIRRCFADASVASPDVRRGLLSFVVAGAGFTGCEVAGELVYYARTLARDYGISMSEVEIRLADTQARILPDFSEKSAAKAQKKLTRLGVLIMTGRAVTEVDEQRCVLGADSIETRTVIWTAGVRASDLTDRMGLATERGRRLTTDEFCAVGYDGVFAVGDISAHGEGGKAYPAMVENAVQSGAGVARNIIAELSGGRTDSAGTDKGGRTDGGGKPRRQPVKVNMHGAMVSIGPFFAVSELMGKRMPVWLSVIMKYLVNAHYFWTILGCGGVARYLYAEFFRKRHAPNLWERQVFPGVQAFWLTLLRIFAGAVWLYEGLVKAAEGWFYLPKLAAYLGVDAAASATKAAGHATRFDDIFRLNIGLFDFMVGKESTLVEGQEIASKVFAKLGLLHFGNFELMDAAVRNVITANDTVAMFFQILTVILEIAVGLLLIGGLFTFPASLLSLGLMFMFLGTTGVYSEMWYMFPVSVALMGGAGRAFGLDSLAVPYISNVWDCSRKSGRLRLRFPGAFRHWD